MCFEINGLKMSKTDHFKVFAQTPHTTLIAVKTFILKTSFIIYKFTWFLYLCFEMFILREQLF